MANPDKKATPTRAIFIMSEYSIAIVRFTSNTDRYEYINVIDKTADNTVKAADTAPKFAANAPIAAGGSSFAAGCGSTSDVIMASFVPRRWMLGRDFSQPIPAASERIMRRPVRLRRAGLWITGALLHNDRKNPAKAGLSGRISRPSPALTAARRHDLDSKGAPRRTHPAARLSAGVRGPYGARR